MVAACGFAGPLRYSKRAAREAWSRRAYDAGDREKLMRDGAMAVVLWFRLHDCLGTASVLEAAVNRGEVIPKREAEPEPWIVSKPGAMSGKPCVRGTRILVKTLQALASDGVPELRILEAYPGLTGDGLAAALNYRLPKAKRGGRRS